MDKRQEVESVELTKTLGLLQAEIVAGRLRSEGIPVWTWQEGAGKRRDFLWEPWVPGMSWCRRPMCNGLQKC